MQITINFGKAATPKEIAAGLRFQANLLDGMTGKEASSRKNTVSDDSDQTEWTGEDKSNWVETKRQETPAETKARKSDKKSTAPKDEDESFDLGDDNEPDAGEDETPSYTVKDVIKGFQAYAKKHGREKAAKVLAKYKVKSVHELKADQYAKVISEIEV